MQYMLGNNQQNPTRHMLRTSYARSMKTGDKYLPEIGSHMQTRQVA